MTHDESLIPELKEWRKHNGPDFSTNDWISGEGSISLAIGFSFIFWPDFIEHEDCVFIKSHFSEDNFKSWTNASYIQHYAQIESVVNHIHILDLFSYDKTGQTSVEQVKFFGNVLSDMYRVKLKTQFPGRDFMVVFNGDQVLEELIDYEMTFYQVKNETRRI